MTCLGRGLVNSSSRDSNSSGSLRLAKDYICVTVPLIQALCWTSGTLRVDQTCWLLVPEFLHNAHAAFLSQWLNIFKSPLAAIWAHLVAFPSQLFCIVQKKLPRPKKKKKKTTDVVRTSSKPLRPAFRHFTLMNSFMGLCTHCSLLWALLIHRRAITFVSAHLAF